MPFIRLASNLQAIVLFAAIMCVFRTSHIATAEDKTRAQPFSEFATNAEQRQQILKEFRSDFIEITPGKGRYPQEFLIGGIDQNGSPDESRRVTLRHAFAIGKYEVPQNLYAAVMGKNPSVWGGPRNSVEMVSWTEAVAFCRRATTLMRAQGLIAADEKIRLPTEIEWEFCCRAGTETAYSFGPQATAAADRGKQATLLDPYGWHTGNAAGNDPPVGALKPNPWGLYDMHGYLWEYVADEWEVDRETLAVDRSSSVAPKSPRAGATLRVMRGGSWRDHFSLLKSSSRWPTADHTKSDAVGFRCVLDFGQAEHEHVPATDPKPAQ